MDLTLNAVSAQSLSAVSEALKDVSPVAVDASAQSVLGGSNLSVSDAVPDLNAVLAQLRMETNDARLNAARHRLASSLSQLTDLSDEQKDKVEEMDSAGRDLVKAETDRDAAKAIYDTMSDTLEIRENELRSAQEKLDDIQKSDGAEQSDIDAAEDRLDSARQAYDSAKKEYDSAKGKYEASERDVNDRQNRFDELVKSLDMASLTALRDALMLSAVDVAHLHEEIEDDDRKYDISTVRSVEDVIIDALKRLEDKMSDEIEDRQLDHV